MYIAIVDDEKDSRETIKDFLEQSSRENNVKIVVEEFDSGDRFIKMYKPVFDVIILDVDMPGIDGIKVAHWIRERSQNVVLLFITNMAQYAIRGYEVEAIDYAIKPIGYYDFSMKFQRVLRRVQQRQDHNIILETSNGPQKIRISDVQYVEVQDHSIHYHTKKKDYKLRGSMKEHEKELAIYHFSRSHKSYLVNLKYIEKIQADAILLAGNVIPIGRSYKEKLMKDYMQYLKG